MTRINQYDISGNRHGFWRISDSGVTLAYYNHGKLDGPLQVWNCYGYLRKEEHYLQGEKHGKYRRWKWASAPYMEKYYHMGKQIGLARTWQEVIYCEECEGNDSDCGECCDYSRGKSDYSWYNFYPEKTSSRYTIKNMYYMEEGKEDGLSQTFDEYEITSQNMYKEGLKHGRCTEWDIRQNIQTHTNYLKGVRNGLHYAYDKEGNVKESIYYQKGYSDGVVQYIYDDHRGKIYNTSYTANGLVRYYHTDGNIQSIVYYIQGYQNGLYQAFENDTLKSEFTNVFTNEMLDKYKSLSRSIKGVDYI